MANRYTMSGARYNVKSAVYKMAENKFKLYQQLPTTGAEYIHAFTHKGKQYLAVVNKFDVFTSTSDVQVFIWSSIVAAEVSVVQVCREVVAKVDYNFISGVSANSVTMNLLKK